SYLNLMPENAVITNIAADHRDPYGHDFARLKQAFVEFTQRLPFYGVAAVCVDDPCVREIMPFVSKTVVTYGLSELAQIRAVNVQACQGKMKFTVLREDEAPLDITLNLPGDHNVRNSLAAIAVATEIGVSDEAIVNALEKFNGVGRRFQHYGEVAAK
ncbi:MAG: Mur ligase family protein, partial [Limnobacter sp.]